MKNQEIFDFITSNTVDNLKDYNNRLIAKFDGISDTINKISIGMVLCVIVYFLFTESMISSVNVGFITLNKLDIIPQLIPSMFAGLTLYYLILNNHRSELSLTSKIISFSLYNSGPLDFYDFTLTYNNDYVRLYQPFSAWVEIEKWKGKKVMSKFEAILIIPLSLVLLLVPTFEFIAIERLFTRYWAYGFARWSAAISIWISVYCIFWVIRGMIRVTADIRAGVLPQQAPMPRPDLETQAADDTTITDPPAAPGNV
jgi:hypothetical protein